MKTKSLLPLLLFACALTVHAQANSLRVGDTLPTLALNDQHDKPAIVPADLRQVIFAADNGGAGLVTGWLDAQPKDWLQQTKRIYLTFWKLVSVLIQC